MLNEKRAWDIIANYESSDLVRARYFAKHGRRPNAAHAREITEPFIQGRQYYSSAASADKTVKPLLLYYGVVSLSRGLVLFLTRGFREAALAQSHGLSIRDWQTVLSAAPPDIGELQISVNGSGSFVELLRATGNRSLVRADSNAVNKKFEEGPVALNTAFTLGELLARLPDVLDQFKRWKSPRCVRFKVEQIAGSNESKFTVSRTDSYVDQELILDIVGRGHCYLVSVDAQNVVVQTKLGGTVSSIVTDFTGGNPFGIGDLFLAQSYAANAKLGKIGQLFAISYIPASPGSCSPPHPGMITRV